MFFIRNPEGLTLPTGGHAAAWMRDIMNQSAGDLANEHFDQLEGFAVIEVDEACRPTGRTIAEYPLTTPIHGIAGKE